MSANTPNFYAIIPAHVRYCKELEHGAKLLYGELTALSTQKGYCWATNRYLASLYDVDENTIKRWMRSLKEQKFIVVEVSVGGFQTVRKIWISPEIKKFFKGDRKCPEGEKITVTPDDKNVLHINTDINTPKEEREEGEPPQPSLFTYKRVKFELKKLYDLEQEFGKEKIAEMIERLEEYADINPKRFKQYADHATVIRKWIRDDQSKGPKSLILKDKIYAEEICLKLKHPEIQMDTKAIEFVKGQYCKRIEFGTPGFQEQVKNQLIKMGLYDPTHG